MRLLVIGLVFMAVGIGITEYTRRQANPVTEKPTKSSTPTAPATPPTMKALTEFAELGTVDAAPTDALQTQLDALAADKKEGDFITVASGTFTVRELRAGSGFAVAVIEKDKQQALVRFAQGKPVKALAVRKDVVSAVAVSASTVYWAEGSRVFSTNAETGGSITALANLPKALVTSLWVTETPKHSVVATLIPKDLDPFSTDPSGAVVELEPSQARIVAGEQVRPHDVVTDGTVAYFVAGYPSGLVRAGLDGTFSSRIGERADGPLALDGDGIVYRYPVSSSPEVRRTATGGGMTKTLAHFDVDWVTSGQGVARFSTVGIGARLYEATVDGEPKEVLTLKGSVKGLAVGGAALWLAVDESGTTVVRVKP